MQVDDTFRRSGTTVGDFTMLSSKELFIAGSPNVATLQGSKVQDNFRGCLRKVSNIVFYYVFVWLHDERHFARLITLSVRYLLQ